MNKKILISLVAFNLLVLLCWGGMEISRYLTKQKEIQTISEKITNNDVQTGIMSRPDSEKLVKITWKASGKKIEDEDLNWVLALFDKKWKGSNINNADSAARSEIVHFLMTIKTLTNAQRDKLTIYGMGLFPNGSDGAETDRKQNFILLGLATKDPRFLPFILKFSHDQNKEVSTTAKAVMKKLGVPIDSDEKSKP